MPGASGPVIRLPGVVAKYREKTDDVKMEQFLEGLDVLYLDHDAAYRRALDEHPPYEQGGVEFMG